MKGQILSLLPENHPWRNSVFCFDRVGSTNTLAKSMAAQGAPHGTVLIARQQTNGRGRMGRKFLSLPDVGVYLSVILRPRCAPGELMHMTCAVGVAMCRAISQVTGLNPGIKWINDLVCNQRKVAGILTELSLEATTGFVDYAVVGIGVNCRQKETDFPDDLQQIAGSLSMASGKDTDPAAIAAAMIRELSWMDQILLSQKAQLMEQYRRVCVTLGQEVCLHRNHSSVSGMAIGVDDEGALIVEFEDSHREHINSGEASVRGMYGYL